jgi:hypothetical protein
MQVNIANVVCISLLCLGSALGRSEAIAKPQSNKNQITNFENGYLFTLPNRWSSKYYRTGSTEKLEVSFQNSHRYFPMSAIWVGLPSGETLDLAKLEKKFTNKLILTTETITLFSDEPYFISNRYNCFLSTFTLRPSNTAGFGYRCLLKNGQKNLMLFIQMHADDVNEFYDKILPSIESQPAEWRQGATRRVWH